MSDTETTTEATAAPTESTAAPNTVEVTANAVAAEITALTFGDLNEAGDGLGTSFARTANGALYTYDVNQPPAVGDFVVHLGPPALGLRFFATRAALTALGVAVA